MDALPESVPSPMFWPTEQQEGLLRGSPVLKEAKERAAALRTEWSAIQQKVSAQHSKFDPGKGHLLHVQWHVAVQLHKLARA